jgi:hypothetical protein
MLGSLDLQPSTLHNLKAFARANRVSLASMIGVAIDFTTAKEGHGPELDCPDERSLI